MSKLLINESPLVVLPSLAVAVGVDKALVLQQIQYWANQQGCGKNIDGDVWIWNTYSQWVTQFPFWNERKIMKIMSELRSDGLIRIKQFNKSKYDHTNFYSIDINKLETLVKTDTTQNSTIIHADFDTISNTQNGTISSAQIGSIYKGTEITSKTTSDIGKQERLTKKEPDDKLNAKETLLMKPDEVDIKLWESFMKLRVGKKAQQTKRALHGIINKLIECNRYSISMNDMLDMCLREGWKGVDYVWYQNKTNSGGQQVSQTAAQIHGVLS